MMMTKEEEMLKVDTRDVRSLLLKCEGIRYGNNINMKQITKGPIYYIGYTPMFVILEDYYKHIYEELDDEEIILEATITIAKRIYRTKRKSANWMSKGIRLSKINCIGQSIPLWNGGRPAPPLCGSMPADIYHIARINDMVAAKVMLKNKETNEKENLWILARVLRYLYNGSYEVEDMYEETKIYAIKRSNIIPLPLLAANPLTNPEALFKKGTEVLAIYPQVTIFYPAKVKEPPLHPTGFYELLFKDNRYDEINDGYDTKSYSVCPRFVIRYPEEERRKEHRARKMRLREKRKQEKLLNTKISKITIKKQGTQKPKVQKLTKKRIERNVSPRGSRELKRVTKERLKKRRIVTKETKVPGRTVKGRLTNERATKGVVAKKRLLKGRVAKEKLAKRSAVRKRLTKREDAKKLAKNRRNSKQKIKKQRNDVQVNKRQGSKRRRK